MPNSSKNSIVYTQPNCAGCISVKTLLRLKDYHVEERILGKGWSKQDLLADAPLARSVPQVLIDGKLIGGFHEVQEYFRD